MLRSKTVQALIVSAIGCSLLGPAVAPSVGQASELPKIERVSKEIPKIEKITPLAPSVVDEAVSFSGSVGSDATFSATVESAIPAEVAVEWSLFPNLVAPEWTPFAPLGSTTSWSKIVVGEIRANLAYYGRICARNAIGTTCGSEFFFLNFES